MVDTHFKSEQNQFLHLDTEAILSPPLYILHGSLKKEKDYNHGNKGHLQFAFWELTLAKTQKKSFRTK